MQAPATVTSDVIKSLQALMGAPDADGVISGQRHEDVAYYPSLSAVRFDGGSGDSWVVRTIQRKLMVRVTGILDQFTIKAWQQRLIGIGYDCGPYGADGILGPDTATAMRYAIADKKW